MKRFFLVLITSVLVIHSNVYAQQFIGNFISLTFNDTPAIQFLKATYKNMLGLDYIMDPSLAANTKISMSVRDLPVEDFKKTVDTVLHESGIAITKLNGVHYFYPRGKKLSGTVQAVGSHVDVDEYLSNGDIPSVPASVMSGLPPPYQLTSSQPITISNVGLSKDETLVFYHPVNRLPEQLQVIANSLLGTSYQSTDKVFLSGKQKDIDRAIKILQEYDTVPGEILARTLVFEFNENTNEQQGFQLGALVLAEKLSIGINTVMQPLSNVLRFKNHSLDAVLTAVEGDSRFSLITSSSLRVMDGATARINNGQDVPVLAESSLDNNGNPVQSVTYRPSGVIFDLSPRIMRDRIEVKLSQQLSNFQQTKTSTINSPTLTKREVSTTVGLTDGEIIVLGGLDEERKDESRSGLFFLPRFLDSTSKQTTKSQILVVLQVNRVLPVN